MYFIYFLLLCIYFFKYLQYRNLLGQVQSRPILMYIKEFIGPVEVWPWPSVTLFLYHKFI